MKPQQTSIDELSPNEKPSKFFKKINTVEMLRDYIRSSLGEPLIKVEVDDVQIDSAIQDTISLYCEYAADGVEHLKIPTKIVPGITKYQLDDNVKAVKNIMSVSSSAFQSIIPAGYGISSFQISMGMLSDFSSFDMSSISIMNSYFQSLQANYSTPVVWDFNENTKILNILTKDTQNVILLDCAVAYTPKEIDNIYNHIWIKKCATAKVKLIWGNILGKYSGTLIGGSTINYDRLISEAQSELEQLKEELLNTYGEPLGVFVM